MGLHLAQVAVIADVVADAVFVDVFVDLLPAGELLSDANASRIEQELSLAAAEVVDLAAARRLMKASMKRATSSEWMLSRTCLPL